MEPTKSDIVGAPVSVPPGATGEVRILMVEDVALDAELILRSLSRGGVNCTAQRVETLADFERELARFAPDLVLADYSLPTLTGLQVLDRLKTLLPDTPTIIVTAAQSEEIAVECFQHGAEDYVLKASLARLPSAVSNALRRKETERKQKAAEAALRHSEEQYRHIAENVRDLIALLDLHGAFLYASPSFQTVLGYTADELAGRSSLDLAHPEDRPILSHLFDEARLMREPRTADVRYVHKDGRVLIFESALAYIFNSQQNPQRAVVVSRDISDRKRAETEIERLAAFPRNNPNPVLAFSAAGALIYFNDAAQRMAVALRQEHPANILPLNVGAVVKMCLAAGQDNLRLENTIAGRTLCWSFYPIPASQVVHCYAEDVTERLELETRLRQAQKMESVGQLAAGVAHDFNNILTIIQGHSGLLQGNCQLSPGAVDSLRQISCAAERAANLTRQLLVFSRKQLAQRQLIDLGEILKESGKMLRMLLGESVLLHLDAQTQLPAVYADPGMIQQVLINLAANARDAMSKGGHLTIRAACVEVADDHADRFPEARAGRFVCLSATDTGCGMDTATLERIFEPFFTTKDPGQGTGLGLATVYGIVKQHQGWIEVVSEVEKGTRFSLYFPASSKSRDFETDHLTPKVTGGHETILVVEDESILRELVVEILHQYGYKTIQAENGVVGLAVWAERQREIDLVLTDVMMPGGVSGRDLARKIQTDNPRMKVIYSSGYPMDVLGREFFQTEGVNYLQKPYQPHLLAKTVRDCLDAGKPAAS